MIFYCEYDICDFWKYWEKYVCNLFWNISQYIESILLEINKWKKMFICRYTILVLIWFNY